MVDAVVARASRAPRSRLLGGLALAVATVGAVVAATVMPLAANAVPVSLSVTVVAPNGTAATGLGVELVQTSNGASVGGATTDSNGKLTLNGVPAGDYTLAFPRTSTSFEQYLGGAAALDEAQPFTVSVGSAVTLTAALAASGTLAGTVTKSSGAALSGATITVLDEVDGEWTPIRSATSSSSGGYKFTGLEPGDYILRASRSGVPTVFSGGATALENASEAAVLASTTTTQDFVLGPSATVSGLVYGNIGSMTPLEGVSVTAWRLLGPIGSPTDAEAVETAVTGADGAYTIGTLPAGEYSLQFAPEPPSSYGAAFLGGAVSLDEANSFTVATGAKVSGKNITLIEGGASISGKFREQGSLTGIPNARIALFGNADDIDGDVVLASTFTDATGAFSFTGLAAGSYQLLYGTFEDSDPDDGISENTAYERRSFGGITVSAGGSYTLANYESELRVAVEPTSGNDPVISNPYSDVRVGQFLGSSSGAWTSSGYPVSGGYQWLRDGKPIAGATAFSYTPVPGDLGHTLTFSAWRFDWALGYGSFTTPPTDTVLESDTAPSPIVAPSIDGTPEVGETLTLDLGRWEALEDIGADDWIDPGIAWTATWQRSTNASSWSDAGSGTTHLVTGDDLDQGPYLRVLLNGTRYGYPDVVDYEVTPVYLATGSFTNLTAPSVTKTSTQLVAHPGTWSPTPDTVEYEWQVYDAATLTYVSYYGATLDRSIAGDALVSLGATADANGVASSTIWVSGQTGPKLSATDPFVISGDLQVGEILSVNYPNWIPSADSTHYVWKFRKGSKKKWKTIPGATSSSFLVAAKYKGAKLRVFSTVSTPGYAPTSITTPATAKIGVGVAPQPAVAPSTGDVIGKYVTVEIDPGTWSPSPTSITYQWRVRPTVDGTPTAISGATTAAYAIPKKYDGKFLDVALTAKLKGHLTGSYVLELGQVSGGSFMNITPPTVEETSADVLEVTDFGTWDPVPTSNSVSWLVLDTAGNWNGYGSANPWDTSCCAAWAPIDALVQASGSGLVTGFTRVPAQDGTFTVSTPTEATGAAQVGVELTASPPVLSNAPEDTTTTVLWQKNTGSGWKKISGASGETFTPGVELLGAEIRARVTVTAYRYTTIQDTLSYGSVVTGEELEPLSGQEPYVTEPTAGVGVKLQARGGTWSSPGAKLSYQWQIGSSAIGPFGDIVGATGTSYTPKSGDFGSYLRVRVTAKQAGFPSGTFATEAVPVEARPLVNVTLPTVKRTGSTLTFVDGTWDETPEFYQFSWQRVSLNGLSTEEIGTDPGYELTADDDERTLLLTVTASNEPLYSGGEVTVVAQFGPDLHPSAPVELSGDPVEGETLEVSTPSFGTAAASTRYQWKRDGATIDGADSNVFLLEAADVGTTISVTVTTSVLQGRAAFETTLVAGSIGATDAPENLVAPNFSSGGGTVQVGELATTTPGSWSVPGMTYRYQWLRANRPITGATKASYRITPADLGNELRVVVTASKVGYQTVSASSESQTVVEGEAITADGPLSISVKSGTAKAAALTWAKPVTLSYAWYVSTNSGGDWTLVSNASSYATGALAPGTWLLLQVEASRDGYVTNLLESNTLEF